MSGYRRFIAYVYEYQKGKKGNNCGFIKVEVRNQKCRIELHLHCTGIPPQTECKTYGFIRKDGLMNGILLGSCESSADTIECQIETDSTNMADSGIPFGKIGGIVLLTQPGGFFGTEWDDQPVRPDNFREMKKTEHIPAQIIPEAAAQIIPEASAEPSNTQPVSEPDDNSQLSAESADISTESTDISDSAPDAAPPIETSDIEAAHETHTEDDITTAPELSSPAIADIPPQVTPETDDSEEFNPFDDVDFIKCWRIQPSDLARFPSRARSLCSNRFLQYGYYNFGHLLLAQRAGGRFILGVPGGYDQQERFMANMFGFPYFKASRQIELPRNKGGYWCRSIDAPNFH